MYNYVIIFRYINDMELKESDIIHFDSPKKDEYTLTIDKASPELKGKLKVVATNRGGEASAEAKIDIRGRAPEFIEVPQKCTILEGNHYQHYLMSMFHAGKG